MVEPVRQRRAGHGDAEAAHEVVAAAIRQAFNQPDKKTAVETWRHVADQLRARWPKLADLMDESEADVLAYMSFPAQHRTKLHGMHVFEKTLVCVCVRPSVPRGRPRGRATACRLDRRRRAVDGDPARWQASAHRGRRRRRPPARAPAALALAAGDAPLKNCS